MAFIKDGDLYFQDGENLPIILTHLGEEARHPEISSDNQKILFYRREGNEDTAYTINSDGRDERVVMSQGWLGSLELGTEKKILGFIPHTHQLLVTTYLCEPTEFATPCSAKLFIADTDTTAVEQLANLGLAYQQNTPNGNVRISPDGKLIAIGTMDGLRILALDGEVTRESILGYKPSTSSKLFPSLFWLSDSSALIAVLPDALYPTNAYGDFIAHTVWRYSVEENSASQVSLNPPLMGFNFDISPDGKWAIYGGFSGYDTELYLADLTTGHVQIFGDDLQPGFWWGLDSKHFAYGTAFQNISTIDNPSSVINICDLLQWVDAKHFLCRVDAYGTKLRMGEFEGENIRIYNLGLDENVEFSVVVKPE
jgi:Tol biopolymer transport system component